jgi:N-acetylmuramoyl-L-alanine amidase
MVTVHNESDFIQDVLHSGVYHVGTDYDTIVWQSDLNIKTGTYAHFDGRYLTVNFGMHTEPPQLTLPHDLSETIFSAVYSGVNFGIPYYTFTIRQDARFEGHFIDFVDGELRLHLRKRKSLAEGDKPLEGIVFVLDAGHGGTENGALGPMGLLMPEKTINLINTFKLAERLENLGAAVHLTRTADVNMTLQQRIDFTRAIRPDMLISIHADSVAETTNATNIRGFTVWHRNANAIPLAQTTLDFMHYVNPDTNRNRMVRQSNFFICRLQCTPSIITEASFMINIQDFAWMINPKAQDVYADTMVKAILAYFGP